MSSISLAAVAAVASLALAVPASASAGGEPATGATIGNPTPLKVNLPTESEWTSCATEGARCAFTGTKQVRYGANGKFTLPRTFTDGVACENAVFADPAPGVVKQCQVSAGTAPAGTAVTGLSQMKDEAATAAAIGTQPAALTAAASGVCGALPTVSQELAALYRQIKDANARGDRPTVEKLTEQSQLMMLKVQQANQKCSEANDLVTSVLAKQAIQAKAIAGATGTQPAPVSSMGKDEAATAAAIGTQPAAWTAAASGACGALPTVSQELAALNRQIKDANARGDRPTVEKLTEQSQLMMLKVQQANQKCSEANNLVTNMLHKFQTTSDKISSNMR
jgi:hypothetical protein